jgi:hypothetical protein
MHGIYEGRCVKDTVSWALCEGYGVTMIFVWGGSESCKELGA